MEAQGVGDGATHLHRAFNAAVTFLALELWGLNGKGNVIKRGE